MIAVLPYWNFDRCATCLDDSRLQDQIGVVKIMLDAIIQDNYRKNPWIAAPGTKMWKPWPEALAVYGICLCNEILRRKCEVDCVDILKSKNYFVLKVIGLRLDCLNYFSRRDFKFDEFLEKFNELIPDWIDDKYLFKSQKSYLIQQSDYYRKLWPNTPDNIPLYYPKPESD